MITKEKNLFNMLITFDWKVPHRSDACQNTTGAGSIYLNHVLYKKWIKAT